MFNCALGATLVAIKWFVSSLTFEHNPSTCSPAVPCARLQAALNNLFTLGYLIDYCNGDRQIFSEISNSVTSSLSLSLLTTSSSRRRSGRTLGPGTAHRPLSDEKPRTPALTWPAAACGCVQQQIQTQHTPTNHAQSVILPQVIAAFDTNTSAPDNADAQIKVLDLDGERLERLLDLHERRRVRHLAPAVVHHGLGLA